MYISPIAWSLEGKSATVIVKDDSFSLAIGRKGVNARLAVRLTGYNIDIKTESDALNEGFEFVSLEEVQAVELENLRLRAEAAAAAAAPTHAGEVLPGLPEGYVAPQERVYEDEEDNAEVDEALREKVEDEEFIPSTPKEEATEEPASAPVEEEIQPAQEEVIKEVKTTTTIADLEKSLESESKGSAKKSSGKKGGKKKVEEEEEVVIAPKQDPSTFMSIYTEEELREMEEEEQEEDYVDEEDVDYDEYDDYYDDDDK